jgi:hypothetical protein
MYCSVTGQCKVHTYVARARFGPFQWLLLPPQSYTAFMTGICPITSAEHTVNRGVSYSTRKPNTALINVPGLFSGPPISNELSLLKIRFTHDHLVQDGGPVAGSCEHGNVSSGSIKGGEFLD